MMTSMAGMVATDCRAAQEMTISSALKTSTTTAGNSFFSANESKWAFESPIRDCGATGLRSQGVAAVWVYE